VKRVVKNPEAFIGRVARRPWTPRSMDHERTMHQRALEAWAGFLWGVRRFLEDERGGWFIALLIGLAINIVAYLLMPRQKQEAPPAAQQQDTPTASAGKPITKIVGTVLVKELNVLDFRDKGMLTYTVHPDGTLG
jgi:hypothetical protein